MLRDPQIPTMKIRTTHQPAPTNTNTDRQLLDIRCYWRVSIYSSLRPNGDRIHLFIIHGDHTLQQEYEILGGTLRLIHTTPLIGKMPSCPYGFDEIQISDLGMELLDRGATPAQLRQIDTAVHRPEPMQT